MKILLDVFGCDNPPEIILDGVERAMAKNPQLQPVLSGNKSIIEPILLQKKVDLSRIEFVDAKEVITNDDSPTAAMRSKPDSSLIRGIETIKTRDDILAMITAGSTGAVLTALTLKLGRMEGVLRPALAPIMPTLDGGSVCLVDCGANVDCKNEYLVQFAQMGSAYMRAVKGIERPRVALVSVGTEDKKGNELTKEAFLKLMETDLNFVGNMEARDIFSGKYDVIVCDGFVGNVLLKTMEGTLKMVLSKLKTNIKSSSSAKFGYLFMKGAFGKLKDELDYNAMGGASFLGVNKNIVKCHGGADADTVCGAFSQAIDMVKSQLLEKTKQEIQKSL